MPTATGKLPGTVRMVAVLLAALATHHAAASAEPSEPTSQPEPAVRVPPGFEVELVAGPPLVGHPMMACFDEAGRLYVAESAGHNLNEKELEARRPNFIRRLEDTDGDGRFDRSVIFADRLMIPNGACWLDGALYVAEAPGIWRLEDTDGDGVADRREHIAGQVSSNGMSSTLHGPFLSPTGRLFWCGGQLGYSLDKNASAPGHRIAPGVFMLRPDGSGHELFAVGGMANPVEVTFTAEGDVLGTVAILARPDGQRHDAMLHWVYGGVYETNPNDPCPLKRTGPPLPPLCDVGQVAPAGLTRYRGRQFGPPFRDNVFWTHFNTHQVIRTRIERHGATFMAQDEVFLASASVDFHPTDVLEDADGSLLVVDTGGWFRHGCPTSQIARPEIKGGIWRVRRTAAPEVSDPRGLKLGWDEADCGALAARLDDPRPAVQDRAVAALARCGLDAIAALQGVIASPASVQARQNAVWTLARIGTPEAFAALRHALGDAEAGVRQAAVHAVAIQRDVAALAALIDMIGRDPAPAVRREVAAALGRLGQSSAVPALLAALSQQTDRFLEHAIVYAVIEIGDVAAARAGLADRRPAVRRGALLALTQMPDVRLSSGELGSLLRGADGALREAAFAVAARQGDLEAEIAAALGEALGTTSTPPAAPTAARIEAARPVLLGLARHAAAQQVLAEAFRAAEPGSAARRQCVALIAAAEPGSFPAIWLDVLRQALDSPSLDVRQQALTAIRQHGLKQLDGALAELATDEQQPISLRLAALDAVAARLRGVDDVLLAAALGWLDRADDPATRLTAARTVASLELSDRQLLRLADELSGVDLTVLPTLVRAFHRGTTAQVGLALVRALEHSDAVVSLSADELRRLVDRYPPEVGTASSGLFARLGADAKQLRERLDQLSSLVEGGDFARGREVFFGKKAACSNCHRVHGVGGLVGPNLTQIAEVRTPRDLLESIVVPSASIVQGYHTLTVLTSDGQAITGIVTRQTPEALWLWTADLAQRRIAVAEIESMAESSTSLMPKGLDTTLSVDELRDLLAFLQGLKRIAAYATD